MNINGKKWEIEAFKFLRKKKYKLIEANYMTRFGEIDLIVSDKQYLCFVEVKQRNAASPALPREYVDYSKQRKMCAVAGSYLSKNPTKLQPRFDVVEIYTKDNKIISIKHLENAFDLV